MKSFHRGLALLLTVEIAASATDPSRRRLAGSTACGPETGVVLGSDPAKPIDLGGLTNYLFFFEDGSSDTNWQGATKGFYGDVAVDGINAAERTSGGVPYAGTIYTNDVTVDAFQDIIDQNVGQASSSVSETALIDDLTADFNNAWATLDALPFDLKVDAGALHNANYQNGVAETIIVDINSGYSQNSPIELYGDANDMFVFRWGKSEDVPYNAQVKFSGGGGIIPKGGLTPGNFVHLAGDLNASGGGSNPPAPFPQGPRPDDGQGALITGADDWGGGGFFVGYWVRFDSFHALIVMSWAGLVSGYSSTFILLAWLDSYQ